jgi:hypothetical protein
MDKCAEPKLSLIVLVFPHVLKPTIPLRPPLASERGTKTQKETQ